MTDEQGLGRRLFHEQFRQIEKVIGVIAHRKGLSNEEAKELYSLTMLKIVDDDFAVLRKFYQRSSWNTYLTVVVSRILLDERARKWKRWRPSAVALRLGETARLLDQRINRDGWPVAEAIADLRVRGITESSAQLEDLAAQIPRRFPRHFLPAETALRERECEEWASGRLDACEQRQAVQLIGKALRQVLRAIPETDRRLLELRFAQARTVRDIAELEGLPARPLYSRFERVLRRLQRQLKREDIEWSLVSQAIGSEESIDVGFGASAPE